MAVFLANRRYPLPFFARHVDCLGWMAFFIRFGSGHAVYPGLYGALDVFRAMARYPPYVFSWGDIITGLLSGEKNPSYAS